jgi:hypothetical protein
VNQDIAFGLAFPLHFRRNACVLVIEAFNPIMVDDVLTVSNSCQYANAVMPIQVWIVKRNSASRVGFEEQWMMFDLVFFSVTIIPETVACQAVISPLKPDCPDHIGQIMKSPFKDEFKGTFKVLVLGFSSYSVTFPRRRCYPSHTASSCCQFHFDRVSLGDPSSFLC